VGALRELGEALGKTDWNFSVDPCSGLQYGWIKPNKSNEIENTVTCGCGNSSSNGTVCHVVSMYVISLAHLHLHIRIHRTYICFIETLLIYLIDIFNGIYIYTLKHRKKKKKKEPFTLKENTLYQKGLKSHTPTL
jgi:hypothetical protein